MLTSPAGMLFILLCTVAAAAIAYAFLQPRIESEKNVGQRRALYTRGESDRVSVKQTRDRLNEQNKRRKTIQSSLKELETRQKARENNNGKINLQRRIEQAGWTISVRAFVIASVVTGVVAALLALIFGLPLFVCLGAAVVGGFGLPRLVLARARKKRLQKFSDEFPNAIDLIVRGVKSGLPLGDTLKMVSTETLEPVRSEFRKIIETQQMGIPIAEAVERLYRNVPTSETNFFSIVIGIQAQAGGNLSEALGNLSRVLRDRKRMKAKIQAMSMEAKASGGIIGSLPVIVATLVYITSPDYISVLFVTTSGNIVLGVAAFWMAVGIFIMKQMINFDF